MIRRILEGIHELELKPARGFKPKGGATVGRVEAYLTDGDEGPNYEPLTTVWIPSEASTDVPSEEGELSFREFFMKSDNIVEPEYPEIALFVAVRADEVGDDTPVARITVKGYNGQDMETGERIEVDEEWTPAAGDPVQWLIDILQ